MEFLIILFPLLVFIYVLIALHISRNQKSIIPKHWPFLGTIPATLVNAHRLHDYTTDVLASSGGTFVFKGSWLSAKNKLCTTNPLDIHHVLSKNFTNYPRGQKFRNVFDILGDGFSNTDGDLWEFHHKTILSLLKSPCFQTLLEETIWNKVERGLLPVLDSFSKQGLEMDLQEIFQRFAFDTICKLLFDDDPKSMSLEFPYIPCEKALSEMEEAILHRYIMPPSFWKLQQLLKIGNGKKLNDAWKTLDQFIYKCLAVKQKEFSKLLNNKLQEEKFKLSTALLREYKDKSGTSGDANKFLRDTLLNLMVAGRDTTSSTLSWFFYLLAKNPIVEDKIREELHTQLEMEMEMDMAGNLKDLYGVELCKLVYLHGALSEALRLFPPIPFQHKTPLKPDILPSGHQVDESTIVILSYYGMGRMKSIWGEDCMEFKPERWVSTSGRIKHEPSYKFPAFNAGPRTCLGKQMSFTQMKIVAATIIYRYHVHLVEGHLVLPSESIVLQMKNGLKVRLTKRREVKM
ncbi:alkane hydroxylase MAH1-like [Cynara cardunculus var. scolymus]|uniref:Cytochrome P450 n=1 Tax=Cynara cardunculus var. scolymus TaxID=59895 RepID=A0A103Y9U2_CYNCS|nr:alkane hydroxylase MAH1-like [Cynara cardunculus var. scolymus]KVI05165.1 cytochrome P450 [Cynara cardunculus var. scolymus]